MFSPNILLKQSIAGLLPVSFLWVFVGCVSICTEHSIRQNNCETVAFQRDEICNEKGCCPITPTLSSILPDRRLALLTEGDRQITVPVLAGLTREPLFYQHHS